MARKLKVNVSMALASSTGSNGYWRVDISDALSGVGIVTLEMSAEQFGRALGAQYQTEVDATVPDPEGYEKVGLRRENKRVEVPVGSLYGEAALEVVRAKRAEYEVDGWTMRSYDIGETRYNSHNRSGPSDAGFYRVIMERWVDPSTPPYEDPPVLRANVTDNAQAKKVKGKKKKAKAK